MKFCPKFTSFAKYVYEVDSKVLIDQDKDKDLRYDVWGTTVTEIRKMFMKRNSKHLVDKSNSQHVLSKIDAALSRFEENPTSPGSFHEDIINSKEVIAYSIAMHEVMESIKGEADKARNLGIDMESITAGETDADGNLTGGTLPALPMSRIAASIGRKISFQLGARFKTDENNQKSSAEIEALYYGVGNKALNELEQMGYVNLHEKVGTIKDYIESNELGKKRVVTGTVTDKVLSMTINEEKMGIKGEREQNYFLNRSDSDISDTQLGAIADMLTAVRHVTQPATIVMPHKDNNMTDEELAEFDDPNITPDPITLKARRKLFDTPLFVNDTVHKLMTLLHEETLDRKSKYFGRSGSYIVKDSFKGNKNLINSLFGLKRSDDYSIDKKDSIRGQNLSKTTPLDDTVENYGILQGGDFTKASPMHLLLRLGRNARSYYDNSVLNPHASKHSRYMLTGGRYTVDSSGPKAHKLIYNINEALGSKFGLTYKNYTGETDSKLNEALVAFEEYTNGVDLDAKLAGLSNISVIFPGVDYVSLLTTMQAVKDVRNPVNGQISTEFQVSADATASGGTLTFSQALGTNDNIEEFLERLGMLNSANEADIDDIYSIMTESINQFINAEQVEGLHGQDKATGGIRDMMEQTVELLFGTDPSDVRELSKSPTMTFVYSQGRDGAIETMSRMLADRVLDDLGNPQIRKYMANLFDDPTLRNIKHKMYSEPGIYQKIVDKLTKEESDKRIPAQLYDILDASINKRYLKQFKARSNRVDRFVQMIDEKIMKKFPFKILPAGAKLAGAEPNMDDIQKFGMPLTKIMEVSMQADPNDPKATVLTRIQKLTKSVADVSPIHGIDAAQLYHALAKVMEKHGVVVVHDEVRGTVDQVLAVEAEYREITKKIIAEYDIHQTIMHSVAAYDPKIAEDPEFILLMADIQEDVDKKAAIMKNFNDETSALIGDGNKVDKFANPKGEAKPKAPAVVKKAKADKKAAYVEPTSKEKLEAMAPDSDIIRRFLSMDNASFVVFDDKNEFVPRDDTIKITKKATIANVEHEIVHANTVAYIAKAFDTKNSQENREVRYFSKSLDQIANSGIKVSEEASDRLRYINAQTSEVERVAEFVAVMSTEGDVATELYNVLAKETPSPRLAARIKRFIDRLTRSFMKVSEEDFAKDVDIEKLYNSIASTIIYGETQRNFSYKEASKYLEGFENSFGFGPVNAANKGIDKTRGALNYANYALSQIIKSQMENRGRNLAGSLHDMLLTFPRYVDVANKMQGIYDSSTALQQTIHAVTNYGTDEFKTRKANILSSYAKLMGEHSEIVNSEMGRYHKALSGMSAEKKKTIGRFVTEMPLGHAFGVAGDYQTAEDINARVVQLEANLKSKKQTRAITDVDNLIAWNVTKDAKAGGDIYNLDARYSKEGQLGEDVRSLLALKSIQAIGVDEYVELLENTELANLLRDSVFANQNSLFANGGSHYLNDSQILEEYKEPFQAKAITIDELKMYEYGEETGWEVLQKPTRDTLGIVWMKSIDHTGMPGVFTDIKLKSGDIEVTGKKAEYMGVVKREGGHKLRLTHEQKLKMGLIEDFTQGLVRGTAHNMSIQESQIIRDEILKEEVYTILGSKFTELEDKIAAKNVDNPWFIKMKEGQSYNDMSDAIKAKYMPLKKSASNVKNFNENVDLVRKDISHWLMGGSAKSVFTNPKYKWMLRITKDLVASAKIGMVVMNPLKIFQDNVSNVSYLSVMGVDPRFVAKNYKDIATDYQSYAELQSKVLQNKVKLVSRPNSEKIKKQISALQDRVKKHPLGGLSERGFINSLGSDLVAKNADTLSGLQADMHTALEYLLLQKDGKKNFVSHFILRLQALGFEGEDFLHYIGKVGKSTGTETGKGAQRELDSVYDRLKEIRNDDDIINYVAQYTNSPGSEAVRVGSAMTDLTDVMAKETLWRHYTENESMSDEDARIKVIDSFPDYKENMPLAIKQLSDVGIIMFPSFWLRIQKVIYRMARDKPVNLGMELMLEEAVGSDVNTILDANLVSKSQAFGGLGHSPTESIGWGSPFPTHLW